MRDFLVAIIPFLPSSYSQIPRQTIKELARSWEVERYIAAVIREYGLERGLIRLKFQRDFTLLLIRCDFNAVFCA